MKRFLAVVLVLLAAAPLLRAQGADDQYVTIYNLIQEADSFNDNAHPMEALPKYIEAQKALDRFQKSYPDWNVSIIKFRISYVADKVASLSAKLPAPPERRAITQFSASVGSPPRTPPKPGEAQPPKPTPPADWEAQLTALRDQVRQLQSETGLLESKLKEALEAQPPAAPPQELAKAQEQIKSLEKEKDLLNVRLQEERQKTNGPAALTPAVGAQELASALARIKILQDENDLLNRRLADERRGTNATPVKAAAVDAQALAKAQERIRALEKENDLLNTRLSQAQHRPGAAGGDSQAVAAAQQALTEANRKLAEQTRRSEEQARESAVALAAARQALDAANSRLAQQSQLAARLAVERDALAARLRTLGSDSSAMAALREENQILKRQLAEAKNAPATAAGNDEAARELARSRAQVAALQSDKEMLRLEKIALESRVRKLVSANSEQTEAGRAEDTQRISELTSERDDLQKRLEAALREQRAPSRNGNVKETAHLEELETQMANLRARLEVFEARQVPYSAEELALFQPPPPQPAKQDSKAPAQQGFLELSEESRALVASAQKHFAQNDLEKAEQEYLQVLKQNEKNVYVLGNVAAIELGRNHLDRAEKHINEALAVAPKDPYTLSLKGQLSIRREKYQDALDSLSLAAKLEPENAEIQNFLGIALSELGMRGPAETALRKAIALDPDYGGAHHNLAVVYLTQKPPLIELARWHYQKALASGYPRNPKLEKMLETAQASTN